MTSMISHAILGLVGRVGSGVLPFEVQGSCGPHPLPHSSSEPPKGDRSTLHLTPPFRGGLGECEEEVQAGEGGVKEEGDTGEEGYGGTDKGVAGRQKGVREEKGRGFQERVEGVGRREGRILEKEGHLGEGEGREGSGGSGGVGGVRG